MYAKKNRFSWGKAIALLASLLLMACAISGTLAFLVDKDEPITNTFTPSTITTTVEEKFENGVKSEVKIKNTGDTTAWIRAAVVITWQDEAGNVYGQAPVEGTDYAITYSTTDWLTGGDGFYYYTKPVEATKETGVLISECKVKEGANIPEGYNLCVEIICSGLQYKPASVFNDNWGESSGLTADENCTALTQK